MSLDAILPHLRKVKKTATGYIACCPAHEDKSPSMTMTERDGVVLMHCFAGCGIDEIMGAIGVDPAELFPPRESSGKGRRKAAFNAHDVLQSLATELTIVTIYSGDVKRGKEVSENDRARFLVAVGRIETARRMCNG